MKQFYFFLLSALVLASCSNKPNDKHVYFGGEILNPQSDYVLLMQRETVIDTLVLADDNTFGDYLTLDRYGLFSFKHGNEFQYVYLEPSDSISLRINTWDFDESLVFDGRGAEKSDFLLDLFLSNHREITYFYSYFKLHATAFEEKFDAALDKNNTKFKDFAKNNPQASKTYLHLLQGVATYPIYRMKEIYPYTHKQVTNSDTLCILPSDFYDYRANTNLNDSILSDYYAYQNYLSAYIYNDAYSNNNNSASGTTFQQTVLQSIAENITVEPLKNSLLYQEINRMIFFTEKDINPAFLDIFYEQCSDENMKGKIKEFLRLKETVKRYELIKNIKFTDINNRSKTLHQILNNKPALMLLWDETNEANDNLNKRLNYLINKYPKVLFIKIDPDTGLTLLKQKYEDLDQYQLIDKELIEPYTTDLFPRTIIIKKGEIINNFPLVFNYNIEKNLATISR